MDEKQIRYLQEVKKTSDNDVMFFDTDIPGPTYSKAKFCLAKGKYDIHFVIDLLHIIIAQVDMYKFNTCSADKMALSLTHSLKSMLSMLEVEADHERLSK